MYVVTDGQGRVTASSMDTVLVGGAEIAPPEGWSTDNEMDWRVVDGVWVYDPLPEEAPLPTDAERLAALEAALLELALGGGLGG